MAQIVTNTPLVERNARYGRWITMSSILLILVPLAFILPSMFSGNSEMPPNQLFLLYGALILSLILSNVGGYFLNRWGFKYYQAVGNALKGTDKKYRLYNYALPVNQVLLTPYGVTVLLLKNLEGRVTANQNGWRANVGILQLLRYFSAEKLGDPPKELENEIARLKNFIQERVGENFVPPFDGLIIFTNPRAQVEITNLDVPVVMLNENQDALKNALRKPKNAPQLKKEMYDTLYELFEEEAEARQVEASRGLVIAGRKIL